MCKREPLQRLELSCDIFHRNENIPHPRFSTSFPQTYAKTIKKDIPTWRKTQSRCLSWFFALLRVKKKELKSRNGTSHFLTRVCVCKNGSTTKFVFVMALSSCRPSLSVYNSSYISRWRRSFLKRLRHEFRHLQKLLKTNFLPPPSNSYFWFVFLFFFLYFFLTLSFFNVPMFFSPVGL